MYFTLIHSLFSAFLSLCRSRTLNYFIFLLTGRLNISYWIGLLATDFLRFCLSKKVFVFHSLLKNNYTRCRLLMLWHLYFNILNISLHSLLVCLFSGGKSVVILFPFSSRDKFFVLFCIALFYRIYLFFFPPQDFSLFLVFWSLKVIFLGMAIL